MSSYNLPEPKIEADQNWFSITFERPDLEKMSIEERFGKNVGKKRRQKIIIQKIKNKKDLTYKSLAKELGTSEKTIERDIQELKNKKYIKYTGPKKGGHWEIIQNE